MTFIYQVTLSLITVACAYVAGKLNIPGPDAATLAGVAAAVVGLIAYGAGVVIKWMQAKKISTAERIVPGITSAPTPPPSNNTRNLTAIFAIMFIGVGMLAGCGLTPKQTYTIDKSLYIGADIGLTAGVASGKIPQTAVPAIQADLGVAKTNLDAGAAWIAANPNLANTPGMYPAEFAAIGTAIDILQGYILKYSLLAPLPTATKPATQP